MPRSDAEEILESNRQAADSIAFICERYPGAAIVELPGLLAAWCNTTSSIFNGIFLTHPVADRADLRCRADALARYLKPKQMPPLFLVCEEWIPEALRNETEAIFATIGLHPSMTQTGMAADELPPPRRPAPPEIEWRRIADQQTRNQLSAINSRARGRTPGGTSGGAPEPLSIPEIWTDQVTGFVGMVNGEPVTTATAMALHGALHIVAVATVPEFQRRGYAEAAVRRALAEASGATGFSRTTLHASDEGVPAYLRMGYRQTAVFTGYKRPPGR